MLEFSVKTEVLLTKTDTLKSIIRGIDHNKEMLEGIRKSLLFSGQAGDGVNRSLRLSSQQLDNIIKDTKAIQSTLLDIISNYVNAERKIQSSQNAEKENPAFDGEGLYGGNQGNPARKSEQLADIVRKYYPNFTDDEVENYLKKLNSEGCGYIALINTIFSEFTGREDDFEKTFGFPMYDVNGDLNYDAMVTDAYSAMDNHNEKNFLWIKWDEVNEEEDPSDTEGYGTTRETREYRWETYLKDHDIDVDVKNVDVTADNYNKLASEGNLVVGVSPCVLYDSSGALAYESDGGHAMTVTGITDDGMYKVSSWGKEYYIKPDDSVYDHMLFQQVVY